MNENRKPTLLNIFWFRKDLRLEDNFALSEFLKFIKKSYGQDYKFAFIYIKNNNSFSYFGEKRIYFLNESLIELSESLNYYGLKLHILRGSSSDLFKKLVADFGRINVFANKQVEPYSVKRDNIVKKIVESSGGKFNLFSDTTIFDFGKIIKDDGTPYTVFTPFKKKFLSLLTTEMFTERFCDFSCFKNLDKENSISSFNNYETYDPAKENKSLTASGFLKGGSIEGLKHLRNFYNNSLENYKKNRDFPALNGTSLISSYLHFGTISIRECFETAYKKLESASSKDGIDTWISELIWREFYYHITYHFPHVMQKSFRPEYENIKWDNNELLFEKWKNGQTGFPIVDAGMRQLVKDGWMHNRVRMITASFLTKDLLIDWMLGEKFFAEHLIDLDFSSNNGGWQWSASTGCDAQPYFRIFNPYLQSVKFDPDGSYIRKYVSELSDLPANVIHNPSDVDGIDYPEPVVVHSIQKNEALKRYRIKDNY